MNWLQFIIGYLLFVNVVTFITYGIDKYKAKNGKWRISEASLLPMAVFGGSIGAWLGMKDHAQEVLHRQAILQLALAGWLAYKCLAA